MNKYFSLVAGGIFLASSFANAAETTEQKYKPNELIIKFKGSTPQELYNKAAAQSAPTVLNELINRFKIKNPIDLLKKSPITTAFSKSSGIFKVDFDGDIKETIANLSSLDNVEYVQPNYEYKTTMAPNDPYYSSTGSWGQSYDDLWGLKTINASTAWDTTQGEGVVVAVIDTGIDVAHSDLANNIWVNSAEIAGNGVDDDGNGYIDDINGWDFAYDDSSPDDLHGHGSHCAGIIAAVGNNGIGVIGVAPNAKLMALKGLNDEGVGYSSDLISAVYYAVDNGANVISASFGGSANDQASLEAVQYAQANNVTIVAAAGNDSTEADSSFPAAFDETIAVGSINSDGALSGFSNYGIKVDVVAPGGEILSVSAPDNFLATNNYCQTISGEDDYMVCSGTSMATPHVAGLAALILSQNPEYTTEQVRAVLRNTAASYAGEEWSYKHADGIVDAQAALNAETPADIYAYSAAPFPAYVRTESTARGSVGGTEISEYRISIAEYNGTSPGDFTLISTFPGSASGDLADLDFSGYSSNSYALKLQAVSTDGYTVNNYSLITVDKSIKEGWPVATNPDIDGVWPRTEAITYADLNKDGSTELYLARENKVYGWDADGNTLDNFPITLPNTVTHGPSIYGGGGSMSIGDIDGDGDDEIVVAMQVMVTAGINESDAKFLTAYHHDGSVVAGFPTGSFPEDSTINTGIALTTDTYGKPPVIADIDNDGENEIVVYYGNATKIPSDSGKSQRLYISAFESNGQVMSGWPYNLTPNYRHLPLRELSVSDLDGNGTKEIVVYHDNCYETEEGWFEDTYIKVFDYTGSIIAQKEHIGTVVNAYQMETYLPNLVVDIDGDGDKEIISRFYRDSATPGEGYQWVMFDHNLNELSGWPVEMNFIDKISVVDIDDDSELEILAIAQGAKIYALEAGGTYLPNYPMTESEIQYNYLHQGSLIQANLASANGTAFISATSNPSDPGAGHLIAFNKSFEVLAGWPKPVDTIVAEVAVSDMDNNGFVDIGAIDQNGWVYVWEEEQDPNSEKISSWPTLGGSNARTNEVKGYEFVCEEFETTNSEHESANRAYSETVIEGQTCIGTYCWGGTEVTTWYAVGSDEELGTSGSTVTTLHSEIGDSFATGSCPTPDTTAPVITLIGDNPLYVYEGSEFVDPGVTATDDRDGDISASVVISGSVNTSIKAQYLLTYSVSDAAGNFAEVTRVVQVITAPACTEYTDTVANHETAGRAYSTEECTGTLYGTYCFGGSMVTTWFAIGSDENLGTDGTVSITLTEQPVGSGVYSTDECPTDHPPQIDSFNVDVTDGTAVVSGTASDADGDLSQIILYFSGGGASCEGLENFTCPAILDLAPGSYTAYLKAVDSRMVDSGLIEVTFTVEGPSAPVIDSYEAERSQTTVIVRGEASDADGDLAVVRIYDETLGTIDCTDTSEFYCNISDLVPGQTYNFYLTAEDDLGNQSSTYGPIEIVMPESNAPVIESWNYELTGNDLVVTGTSSDIDNDIMNTVLYFGGGGLTCDGLEQWSCVLNDIPVGTYTFAIKTSDSYLNDTGLIEFDVTIEASQTPSIDSYETNITDDTLTITGTASDPDGDLETIYYHNGSTYYTCTGTENFTCTITDLAIGDYSVELLAVDATGSESERVTVEYQYNGQAPVIETHSYTTDGLTVTFTGTASDVDGNLDRVVLTLGAAGGVLCTGTETFTCSWTADEAGTYAIGLAAYDEQELSGIVDQIQITVAEQGECITDTNYNHVAAGRAYVGGLSNLYAYAVGSDDDLGLYGSSYYSTTTSLEETSTGYWTMVTTCP